MKNSISKQVDNPNFKGRTGNYGDDRRGNNNNGSNGNGNGVGGVRRGGRKSFFLSFFSEFFLFSLWNCPFLK